ncbi:MAG: hypothetical protein WC227_00585 [Patescibacteria group bacterium]|jgi:hypothetical protein
MNLIEKVLAADPTAPANTFPVLKFVQPVAGDTGFQSIAVNILNWSAGIGAIIAFVFLIIGGFLYLTAGGNAESAKKGMQGILNAVIGLIIIALSYVMIIAVVNLIS